MGFQHDVSRRSRLHAAADGRKRRSTFTADITTSHQRARKTTRDDVVVRHSRRIHHTPLPPAARDQHDADTKQDRRPVEAERANDLVRREDRPVRSDVDQAKAATAAKTTPAAIMERRSVMVKVAVNSASSCAGPRNPRNRQRRPGA